MSLLDDEDDLIEMGSTVVVDYTVLKNVDKFVQSLKIWPYYSKFAEVNSDYFNHPTIKFSVDMSEYDYNTDRYYIGIDYMDINSSIINKCSIKIKLFAANKHKPSKNIKRSYNKQHEWYFEDCSKSNQIGNYKIINTGSTYHPTLTNLNSFRGYDGGWFAFNMKEFLAGNVDDFVINEYK